MAFPIIYLVNKLAAIAGRKKDNVKSVYKIKTKQKRNVIYQRCFYRRLSVVISDPNSLKNQLRCHRLLCNQTS